MTCKEELLDIWTSISIYETIEFINHQLKRVKIDPVPYVTAIPIITRFLEHYSTGQLWSLAYRTMQKACEVILAIDAQETIRSTIYLDLFMQKGIQHINNDWNLKLFERWGFQCRQSDYSKFFFNQVLAIYDEGFTNKPSLSVIGNQA